MNRSLALNQLTLTNPLRIKNLPKLIISRVKLPILPIHATPTPLPRKQPTLMPDTLLIILRLQALLIFRLVQRQPLAQMIGVRAERVPDFLVEGRAG